MSSKTPTYNRLDLTLTSRDSIPIKRQIVHVNKLQFYIDNPRVYSIVHAEDDEGDPDQNKTQKALEKMEHVKQLIQAIRENKGLTDPLLVRGSDNSVLEGNSRLAAYKVLAKRDPLEWTHAKCDVITEEIDNQDVTTLLASYHIIGRKSWDPYEQAGMFWRWHKEGTDLDVILKRVEGMGISANKINHWIDVYTFMVKNKDTEPGRWSHYDELLKSREIKQANESNPKFIKAVATQIKSGKINKAVDVRDKVRKIAKARGAAMKGLIKAESLDKCFEVAVAGGATHALYNKIHKFREVIGAPETRSEFKDMTDSIAEKCRFDLDKIQKYIKRLLK